MAGSGENEMLSWEVSNLDNLRNKFGSKDPLNSGSNSHIPMGIGLVFALPPSPPPPPIERKKRSVGAQKRKGMTMVEPNEEKRLEAKDPSNDHELHVWTERERRKKMKDMFTNLHALLPQLSPKADKASIVDEAVNHIQRLQQIHEKFERKKLERIQMMHGNGNGNGNGIGMSGPPLSLNYENSITEVETREAFMADYVSSESCSFHPDNLVLSNNNYAFPPAFWTWTCPNVVLNVFGEQAQFSVCALKKPGLLYGICFFLQKHSLEPVYCSILTDQSTCMYTIHAQLMKGGGTTTTPDNQLPQGFPVQQIYKQVAAEINFWVTS